MSKNEESMTKLARQLHGRYYIDTDGTVYSTQHNRLKPMSTCLNDSGYPKIQIYIDGKCKDRFVHRLVLEAFRGEQPDMQTRHLDNDRTNHKLSNLQWSTKAENEADKRRFGTLPTGKQTTLTEQDVIEIRKLSQQMSYTQMAKFYGCDRMTISRIVRRVWRKSIA